MENYKYINFNLLDYMFIPKGFEISLTMNYLYKETENDIFTPWVKTYSNDNGKIITKIDNINFDDPFFESFSQKEKDDFLKNHMKIIDLKFCWLYFYPHFCESELCKKITEMEEYLLEYLKIDSSLPEYTIKRNDKILDNDFPFCSVLRKPQFYDVNPDILKYVDIPKGVKLTLKLQYD